jgi:hypothetical protein
MRKRVAWRIILVVGLVAGLLGLPALGASPPRNLKKVGDHWTAWDPPAAAPGAYIIERGDTLWDLAARFYQDPYLWPQIWEENRYITDSHWIYPGDPLVIPGRPTVVPVEGPAPVIDLGQGDAAAVEPAPVAAVIMPEPLHPVADASDLYCLGSILPEHEGSGLVIAAHPREPLIIGTGDVVFLNRGRDGGLEPGDEFAVIRDTGPIDHPIEDEELGHYVRRLGRVRVLLAWETSASAVIDFACEDVHVGDELVPWEEIPAPLLRALPTLEPYEMPGSDLANGVLVAIEDRLEAAATGHVINVDLGVGSGIRPGDILTLYREVGPGLPRVNLAQAIVLTVEPDTATAKIIQSVRETYIGDGVAIAQR